MLTLSRISVLLLLYARLLEQRDTQLLKATIQQLLSRLRTIGAQHG
jgi:hypothetical protein